MVFRRRGINELRALIFHLIVLVSVKNAARIFFYDVRLHRVTPICYRAGNAPLDSVISVMNVGFMCRKIQWLIQLGVSAFSSHGTLHYTAVFSKSTN